MPTSLERTFGRPLGPLVKLDELEPLRQAVANEHQYLHQHAYSIRVEAAGLMISVTVGAKECYIIGRCCSERAPEGPTHS